jgi:hypothetical protein
VISLFLRHKAEDVHKLTTRRREGSYNDQWSHIAKQRVCPTLRRGTVFEVVGGVESIDDIHALNAICDEQAESEKEEESADGTQDGAS